MMLRMRWVPPSSSVIYEVESVVSASEEVGENCQQEKSSVAKDVQQPEKLTPCNLLHHMFFYQVAFNMGINSKWEILVKQNVCWSRKLKEGGDLVVLIALVALMVVWWHQQEARSEPRTSLAYILPPSPRLKYVFDAELFLKSNIGVVSLNEWGPSHRFR